MDSTNNPTEQGASIARRDVLKALAAGGGALAAAAFLPQRWTKPAVNAGVLPAHAQATTTCATVTLVDVSTCFMLDVPCSGDDIQATIFAYQPGTLTPAGATLSGCQVSSNNMYTNADRFPGELIMMSMPFNCSDATLRVTFEGGCNATWQGQVPGIPDN